MHKLAFLAIFLILLSGCAKKNNPQINVIEQQGKNFKEQSQSRTVDVVDSAYIGAKSVPLKPEHVVLSRNVVLRQKGSLSTVAQAITELTSLSVQIAAENGKNILETTPAPKEHTPATQDKSPSSSSDINLKLESLLQNPAAINSYSPNYFDRGKVLNVSFKGNLRGLLDHVAMLSGYGWDFDENNQTITFAHLLVRTFTILGAPGKVSYENTLTNESQGQSSSGGTSSLVGQTVSQEAASAQTAQKSGTKLTYDIFDDTLKAVRGLISKEGVVVCNQSAGTITVKDTPESVRRAEKYIDEINSRLSKQIALNVQVWALHVTDNNEIGFQVGALFKDASISLAAGSVSSVGDINNAAATILTGNLKDSAGVINALSKWGKASQVTSAGGLVMSGQPVPVIAIQRHAYLAGIGKSTTDYGQTTQVNPGEVTTGFAMTVIPYILDNRKVILQYNLNLSSLDEMKEITTNDITIELPQVSTQAFSQRSAMRMGQTLVLCGFEKETHDNSNSFGFINANSTGNIGRTLLVITIKVESADV